jgi:TPR repeat protein
MFRRACEQKYGEACFKLGDMINKGAGAFRQPEDAAEMMKKACDLGFREACGGIKGMMPFPPPAKPDSAAGGAGAGGAAAAKPKPDSIVQPKPDTTLNHGGAQ